MATTQAASSLTQHTSFCPPPLHIQKKPRRTTLRKLLRKSTPVSEYVCGPLDDIIDEITSNLWSPLDNGAGAPSLDWAASLDVPSTWTVTPLPVSRLPRNQPLTIRKNRESRSSASGSSMGDPPRFLRYSSQDEAYDGGPVGRLASGVSTPWPLLDIQEQTHAPSASGTVAVNAREASESPVIEDRNVPTRRRTSVLRLFTGFSRLRRTDTNETNGSGDIPSPVTPTLRDTHFGEDILQEPSMDAVEAYIQRNARELGSIAGGITRRLPSPAEYCYDEEEAFDFRMYEKSPTTLRAAVRVYSEVAQLFEQEHQEFWIAVEVEGALHNRMSLLHSNVDVIFVVDNSYYVSRECLSRALDAVNSAIYNLREGDRVALYTTHCTHQAVTGNRPDLLFPISPYTLDTEEIFRGLSTSIAKYGTQAWKPPRPNPSMAEVILGIAKSLKKHGLKEQRTHVVLLSPASHILHDVSKSCPDLYIHQINPAPLPFRRLPGLSDIQCGEECCKNVFIRNWTHIQSLPYHMKRILEYARSIKPAGGISQICIDIRARDGCEVIKCVGSKDIASLRVGQVYTIFVKVRTTRSATKAVDLQSKNPIFNSSLDIKDLRQQLQNAVTVGAVKVHILDVQLYHRSRWHGADCWNYAETPFLVVRELGGLARPYDTAIEVQKRRLFHAFAQLDAKAARLEANSLLPTLAPIQEPLKRFVQHMVCELEHHQRVLEYEQEHRQRLPLCPGPIDIETSPHERFEEMWDRRSNKRHGVAMVEEEEISGLIDGLHGLERLG
ncbi:hypothetical protein C7974DRAFT_433432 [Boeremia exigua]|uniref:uncharacterized protein n=1 Tax=Boeremia exigua TaxID=749465 RepID=UPI001E8E4620|nr:uncharacterized protein C7974DRAFT_433432 [Boeremia exigua]KAH6633391.1 hypothetical protein C7974DRAFT_433432 [Boeremia exigua]